MPSFFNISRIKEDLAPNIFNSNQVRSWFYRMRTYSRNAIIPPTYRQFMQEWDRVNITLRCSGENIDDCKASLVLNQFPELNESSDIKTATWVRTILALNMYANVRQALRIRHYSTVDFVGIKSDSNNRFYPCTRLFHGRTVLFITSAEMRDLIQMTENNWSVDFWRKIFLIYDDYISHYANDSNNSTVTVPIQEVDIPNHNMAVEYFSRKKNDEDFIPSNKQIIDLLLKTEDLIPEEIKDRILQMCKSYMS